MHFSLIREQLISELGDLDEVFAEFDETAVAAASLGQVHRARLKTGEEVAVKVQYPGIARTIRSDLRNLKALMLPLRLNNDWESVKAQFEEIRRLLEQETDYEQEARNLRDARALFGEDDGIWVPRPFERHSTRRVLTMEWIDGRSFDDFLDANPSQDARDGFGEKILLGVYRLYKHRMLYSDTHPGNFLFISDGRLGLIDFGNLRRFNDNEWGYLCQLDDAKYGTEADVLAACQRSLQFSDDEMRTHAEVVQLVVEGFHHYNEWILFDGDFDFGDPGYLQRGADWLGRVSQHRCVQQNPVNVFSHRLNFQLPALLFRLKCHVNAYRLGVEEYGHGGRLGNSS